MSDKITAAIAKGLDAVRRILWPDSDTLELLKHTPATGYELVETIYDGWNPERVSDPTRGGDFLNFEIAETDTDLTSIFDGKVSHLKMGTDAYKFQGVEKPAGIPRVWVVRCSPTAVTVTL